MVSNLCFSTLTDKPQQEWLLGGYNNNDKRGKPISFNLNHMSGFPKGATRIQIIVSVIIPCETPEAQQAA